MTNKNGLRDSSCIYFNDQTVLSKLLPPTVHEIVCLIFLQVYGRYLLLRYIFRTNNLTYCIVIACTFSTSKGNWSYISRTCYLQPESRCILIWEYSLEVTRCLKVHMHFYMILCCQIDRKHISKIFQTFFSSFFLRNILALT